MPGTWRPLAVTVAARRQTRADCQMRAGGDPRNAVAELRRRRMPSGTGDIGSLGFSNAVLPHRVDDRHDRRIAPKIWASMVSMRGNNSAEYVSDEGASVNQAESFSVGSVAPNTASITASAASTSISMPTRWRGARTTGAFRTACSGHGSPALRFVHRADPRPQFPASQRGDRATQACISPKHLPRMSMRVQSSLWVKLWVSFDVLL